MIILTRLGGHELAINPDLIERAEVTPDTVLTMLDGHKIVVAEALEEVVERVCAWRAGVTARAWAIARVTDGHPDARAGEPAGDDMSEQAAVEATLARVLRLPQRGE